MATRHLRELRGVAAVSPGDRARGLRARAGAAVERDLPVELRARAAGADACARTSASPDAFRWRGCLRIRTVREFDAAFTAPHFGFASAEDYYHRASAMRVVSRIRVPALILSAADDPFVPAELFRAAALTSNPHIRVVVTPHGGHCGFLEPASGDHDGYWAERRIVEFARQVLPPEGGSHASAYTNSRGHTNNRCPYQQHGWLPPLGGSPPSHCARTLNSPDAAARVRRNLGLQLPGVARDLLPGEVQHRQDAGLLRRALPDGRDQLHLLPDAQREAARGLERRHTRALLVHAQGAPPHHSRFEAAAMRGPDAGVLPDRADPRPQARPCCCSSCRRRSRRMSRCSATSSRSCPTAPARRSSSAIPRGTTPTSSTRSARAGSRSASPTARR